MDEETSTTSTSVLLVTQTGHEAQWMSRADAHEWAKPILRQIIDRADGRWEGRLKTVIPAKSTFEGFVFKMIFTDVPECVIIDYILPVLKERACIVKRVSEDEAEAQRKQSFQRLAKITTQIDKIGDVAGTHKTIMELIAMRGTGGSEAKKRKFTDGLAEVLQTSFRVGSAKLQENKSDEGGEKEETSK